MDWHAVAIVVEGSEEGVELDPVKTAFAETEPTANKEGRILRSVWHHEGGRKANTGQEDSCTRAHRVPGQREVGVSPCLIDCSALQLSPPRQFCPNPPRTGCAK